jgi:cobalamin biosynthesis protein CobT
MSLEAALLETNKHLSAIATSLAVLIAKGGNPVQLDSVTFNVDKTPTTDEAEKPKAEKPKAEKPKAEKPKAEKSEKEVLDEVIEENTHPAEYGLPAGVRDEGFFTKHLRPVLVDLSKVNRPLIDELCKEFGVDRLSAAKPEFWGEIYKRATKPADTDEDGI